ncbi:MAG: hypothetical protein EZS28_040329 [Streblomastix strix]|uniref:Uncharacterized protein n=1 Tax=Streblomastix strix TaxID=222440 RepID=A0A5J4U131_9EUKA|nr:MAG: hypothetical protein EZS28_040329 [Streblomastix strix]
MNEPRPSNSQVVRDQQDVIQPNQQTEQVAILTIERSRQNATSRSVNNSLIQPIPAYPEQQPARIPLLPYMTKSNQQLRQNQRSISPTNKRADESEDNDFLDEIVPKILILHLPPHKNNIESAQ